MSAATAAIIPLFETRPGRNGEALEPFPFSNIRRVRISDGAIVPEAPPPAPEPAEEAPVAEEKPEFDVDIAAIVRDTRRDCEAEAKEALAAALAEQQQAFDARLAAERRAWAEQQAGSLLDALETQVSAARGLIEDKIAAVLEPFISEQFLRQTISEAGDMVENAMNSRADAAVTVSGPDDFLEAVRKRLGRRADHVQFETTGAMDLTIQVDDAVIETKFQDWCRLIGKKLGI